MTGIDQIARDRVGTRKGIIHTVSYKRAHMVMEQSDYRKYMMSHTAGTRGRWSRHSVNLAPGSAGRPVMDTGWDFPHSDLRWAIAGKLPWPDTRSVVMTARKEKDPLYMPYLTMQTLMQTYGRGVRSGDDWCEFFIIDSSFSWFFRQYKHLATTWFRKAVVWVNVIPEPLNF